MYIQNTHTAINEDFKQTIQCLTLAKEVYFNFLQYNVFPFPFPSFKKYIVPTYFF